MTFPVALAACLAAFLCHALLHGRRYRLPTPPPGLRPVAYLLRMAAPLGALAGAVASHGVTGALLWFAAASLAGLGAGLLLATRQY
ncbi:hypothetical protein ACOZ4Y_03400 [Komagataeibacter rhaeticus]|uniref:hypothetical protein n=1 Tax=Komagataeibacter rhaeticus TaxID=215221 RepID=UPI0004DA8568|nr:hypothetical protein [Komagataeibacter rhaeticus]KDU96211.1 hypothetical protein GLUCORHAEAF1_03805 [Komagataeibacter rhaeticus AF1]MBL7240670.1 hypothetical protein [Komagataeibacter rhaeticus]